MALNLPFKETAVAGKSLWQSLLSAWPVALAGLGLLVVLILWAKYLRKKPRAHEHSVRPAIIPNSQDEDGEEAERHRKHRHRRRKRRREHRPRNPTLAETGGLPPVKAPPASGSQASQA
jgi:hypothetical protein